MTIDTRQQLLGTINSQIKLNGTGAITGPILNNVLDTMVNSALFQTGAWSQYTSYAPLDVVEYLGNAYVANVANVNIIPSTNPSTWTPFSSASAVAGLSGYVQYNNGTGGLAASSNLTFDGTNLNASVTATGATTSRTLANYFADVININDFGADPTGVSDSTAALVAALASSTKSFVIYFSAGSYKFNSSVTYTMLNPATGAEQTNAIFSVAFVGAGADVTTLTWGSTNGLIFQFSSSQHSIHLRDMTLATTGQNAGNALTLTNSYGYFGTFVAQSDLTNITIRGADGYALNDYWARCVSINQVNDVTFINCNFYGTDGGTLGTGVYLNSPGAGTFVPVNVLPNYFTLGSVYNFTNCNFSFLGLGLYYGNNIQTVQIANCFFAQCTNSIACPVGIYNNSNQGLIVNGSTFFGLGSCITINSPLNNIQIADNFFGVNAGVFGIFIEPDVNASIIGNQFVPYGNPNTASAGVAIQGFPATSVQSIDILTVGSGYTVGTTATVSGGGGSSLSVQIAAINSSGGIIGLTISNRGVGYSGTVTISFSGGTGATFRVNLTGAALVIIDGNTFSSVTNGIILDTASSFVKVGIANHFTPGMTNNVLNAGSNNVASLSYDTSGLKVIDRTGSIGYGAGAGAAVTQGTSKTTTVTLNAPTGEITTASSLLNAGASAVFTVYNNTVLATDIIVVSNKNGNYTTNIYGTSVGSFVIRLTNISGSNLTDAVVINFARISGSAT